MIQNIKLQELSSIDGNIKQINFGNRNIIIGPKGGGKSTMFDLLANAVDGKILSTSIEALEKHNLALHSITIDNEEIPASSLGIIKIAKGKIDKEKASLYDKRYDVIYQDDNIKKNLADSKKFDKAKLMFVKELLDTSVEINSFVSKIKDVYDSVSRVTMLNSEKINFSNTFKLGGEVKASDEQIIFDLAYSNRNIKYKADQDTDELNRNIESYQSSINSITRQTNLLETPRDTFISKEYGDALIKHHELLTKSYREMMLLSLKEKEKISMIKKVTSAFGSAYTKFVTELKTGTEKHKSEEKILASYKSESKNHFIMMAKRIKEANKAFDEFIIKKVGIEFNSEKDAGNLLKMELKENIVFSEEQKFEFMKKVLFNAKKVQTHVANWIMSAIEKGVKEFKTDVIFNKIGQDLKALVKVTANGQEYETMSLGQKSIYGIRYKFNHSKNKAMFLDQPEDNLDNHTIATDILGLINDKKEQMFIITHNANIGILSKADKVIVGSFDTNNEDNQTVDQYLEGKIKESEVPSDAAHYLEGGIEYIKDRLQILKGEI